MDDSLEALLYPNDGERVYAVIDGASCEELLEKLDDWEPDHTCLYAGELAPDMQEVAPYLVELRSDQPFSRWLLGNFHGKSWGIFARSPANLRELRKHFRKLLMVRTPDAKVLYFRFYDPRVLSIFLPTTNADERASLFGPISAFFCEADGGNLTSFRCRGDALDRQDFPTLTAQRTT